MIFEQLEITPDTFHVVDDKARLLPLLRSAAPDWNVSIEFSQGERQLVSMGDLKRIAVDGGSFSKAAVDAFMTTVQKRATADVFIFTSVVYDELESDNHSRALSRAQWETRNVVLADIKKFILPACINGHWRLCLLERKYRDMELNIFNCNGPRSRTNMLVDVFAVDFFNVFVWPYTLDGAQVMGLPTTDVISSGAHICLFAVSEAQQMAIENIRGISFAEPVQEMRYRVAWDILAASEEHSA
jgi:hypothetical protein